MKKRHSPDFKAKAVLKALKEERPFNQIASDLEVHPNVLSTWVASAVKGLATLFERENKAQAEKEASDKQREELYAEIGKLTTQVAWLKKNLALTFRRDERWEMLERSGLAPRGTVRSPRCEPLQSLLYTAPSLRLGSASQTSDRRDLHRATFSLCRKSRDKARTELKKQLLKLLFHGKVSEALGVISEIPVRHQAMHEMLISYLTHHSEEIIDYARRAQGKKTIGSGRMEKGVDQVIGQRQKDRGMSWSVRGSYALGMVSAYLANGQWDQLWNTSTSVA